MAFYAAFTLFSVLARGKSIASELVEMDFEQAVSSSFREFRGNEKGTTPNFRGDWFRFKRSPPASTPDSKAADGAGNCT